MSLEEGESNSLSITLGGIAILCFIGVLTALTKGVPACASASLIGFPCLGWELLGLVSIAALIVVIIAWGGVHSLFSYVDRT